jgi:hypothetical protein
MPLIHAIPAPQSVQRALLLLKIARSAAILITYMRAHAYQYALLPLSIWQIQTDVLNALLYVNTAHQKQIVPPAIVGIYSTISVPPHALQEHMLLILQWLA